MSIVTGYESQALTLLACLALVAVKASLAYLVPRAKKAADAKLTAAKAETANHIIDGLAKVTLGVVQEGNQLWIADTKKNGVFTKQMALDARQDAIRAVIGQAPALVALGKELIGDIPALVGSLVDKTVAENHIDGVKPSVEPQADQPESEAEATLPEPAQTA